MYVVYYTITIQNNNNNNNNSNNRTNRRHDFNLNRSCLRIYYIYVCV